jgi:two-component system, OmpR family, sensor histidine kinase KdpD
VIARPDPDELLRRVQDEETRARRGKLTVFFGAAPGVGKTYAMLEAARSERDLKRDVVVGIVETHGRYDTAALLIGLELLPKKKLPYHGMTLEEMDLDLALARKPGIVLVDELAHTNAEGSRHPKRWQDVEELLQAGIDVYTTLNVQHIESLNDVVAQITGVVVRETVPDSVLERADDVRIIDLPPDELLDRLKEGKVYVPEQARRAIDHFFKKGNLIALRELALRQTAARVDEQMRVYQRAHGIDRPWPVAERLLVCVSPSPASARLVRAARRMAAELRAEWIAAYVETPVALRLPAADRERVAANLRFAEQLGADTVTLSGANAAEETVRYARSRNVTKIVVGRPTYPRWREILRASFLDQIVRESEGVDVYVISGEGEGDEAPARRAAAEAAPLRVTGYLAGAGMVVLSTTTSWLLFGQAQLPDVVMVHLLGIVLVAMRLGYGPSLLAAVLSVLTVDFFFVPPYYSFAVSDVRHIVTFAVMFIVAIVISGLAKRIRDQADAARHREQRTAILYAMTRELASARATQPLLVAATRHLYDIFDSRVAILLPNAAGEPTPATEDPWTFTPDEKTKGVVTWVWEHEQPAGLSTDTLPSAPALFLPLRGSQGKVGVLGMRPADTTRFVDPEQRRLLELFASQIAAAVERVELAADAQKKQLEIEAERLRSSLLSSVSHDLRTPLAVVTGAASTLREDLGSLSPEARRDLLDTIHEETLRLTRLVRNLLDMTRLASGALRVTKEWQPLEEIVGAALGRVEDRLGAREVTVDLPEDLPLVPIDAVLLEQVLINLLENAAKYTPEGSPIELSARASGPEGSRVVTVEIADRGPGIPGGDLERVFEKFFRLTREGRSGGAGLGLAICRGVVEAHGGKIWAQNRDGGGASFCFTLPLEGEPPELASQA